MRKFYALFLVLVLGSLLGACGASTPAPTPTAIAQATTETSLAESTATPDPSTDPLKLLKGSIGSLEGGYSGGNTIYKVVLNHEEQYSIWPDKRVNALRSYDAGSVGIIDVIRFY